MKAKTIGFDRRLNPQARYSTPGLPKTTQLISKDTFEKQIKTLAKSVSYPADSHSILVISTHTIL